MGRVYFSFGWERIGSICFFLFRDIKTGRATDIWGPFVSFLCLSHSVPTVKSSRERDGTELHTLALPCAALRTAAFWQLEPLPTAVTGASHRRSQWQEPSLATGVDTRQPRLCKAIAPPHGGDSAWAYRRLDLIPPLLLPRQWVAVSK